MSEEQDRAPLPVCVVVDCNEWIRLKWLGSPVGLLFMSTMTRDPSIRLAIPEVLDSELDKHRAETARTLLGRLRAVVDEINTVTGRIASAGPVSLVEEEIDVAIRERLSAISGQVLYPEMRVEEVRGALRRVNAETPPNAPKNPQMKDSLIWEACLSLTANYRVFFVTGDRAFYADRDAGKGLAANLAAEPPVQQGRLSVFPSLADALPAFAPETAADASEFAHIGARDLIAILAENAFSHSHISADLQPKITLRGVGPTYLRTDVPHVFAVSFIAFFYVNQGVEDMPHGEAAVTGQCRLDTRTASIDAVNLQVIHWNLDDPNGGPAKKREALDALT